jgi:hypothetical protein
LAVAPDGSAAPAFGLCKSIHALRQSFHAFSASEFGNCLPPSLLARHRRA